MSNWQNLIRFTATNGKVYFSPLASTDDLSQIVNAEVTGYLTVADLEHAQNGQKITMKQLLAPIPYSDGHIICIGVNYSEHAAEANLKVPEDPVMWYKPRKALGPPGVVDIPRAAAEGFLDFEGELTIVTSKEARDVNIEDAEDYILGYTVGNDLTARAFQDPVRSGGQFTRCKAFDGFAPLGPVLTSAKAFGSLQGKTIVTKVNGKVFQDSPINLINDPAKLISFLSQGVTLPAGSCIMTGSPPGIGFFQKPKYSLQDNDVVDITITSIGTLSNTMRFEKKA
ncbi:fumarylacetoacetate hydrolase family protein [Pyrenochaeta sp. DS3sAY3a]|nr:fumarylacetoacetate hydrolase family protein [Pyrenochaeta sp. DS3sAY3a]